MSKIRLLSDHLANQIAAGEVVERPASVAKELVENAIDAGARRLVVDVEAGGRRLLRVADDGCGMTRDDALLAFERHATSKIASVEDLNRIATLGFRGEALASIASIARVELVTCDDGRIAATRIVIEGGRMRDVKNAAHPRGTTISVRDLFFNVPARRKFLRSEATESFHLTNLITHYALAHPEIAFTLTNNGREVLRATPAADLRERAYQIFGAGFLENLLELSGSGQASVAQLRGYVSAPIERRTSRDAQYLFVNGRFVRDRFISRALAEGYRTILPPGTYPVALLFLEVPLEEVDVNVHPAKTEVRFRRAAAVADVVRETVRHTLASAGHARFSASETRAVENEHANAETESPAHVSNIARDATYSNPPSSFDADAYVSGTPHQSHSTDSFVSKFQETTSAAPQQNSIEFDSAISANGAEENNPLEYTSSENAQLDRHAFVESSGDAQQLTAAPSHHLSANSSREAATVVESNSALPPIVSAAGLMREVSAQAMSKSIRPLGQLDESFIIAVDAGGLLLIDQQAAHERILFDKYLAGESLRAAESQHLLTPVTFDLTPAQAIAFDAASHDLEAYGFGLMRLSGRTVAIKSVPAELPASEARNLLSEILETVNFGKRDMMRATSRERIAASLARRAAIKSNTALSAEKMQWLIDSLLKSSSPTTCPRGRPVVLRLAARDILRGFHRT